MPNPAGKNGAKPSPPEDELRPFLVQLVARGFSNPDIVQKLRKHFDTNIYATSESLVKKKRAEWGLRASRGQAHTIESIELPLERVRIKYPSVGCRVMKAILLREEHIAVSKSLILDYMNLHHREEVLARKAHRLKRKQYWTVGVNDTWCLDQHDKWRRFQLFLHVAVEPHSGYILWLKIWWTNRNPRLVCGWYCDVIEQLGYVMPLLTQSDPGTENNGVANAQTFLRHRHDPSLSTSLQHKFKGNKGNVKPEIAWRRLRYTWTAGFETLLQQGLDAGWYDPDVILERMVFHYVFIPWLQDELDHYVDIANDMKPRFNRHKILPHGRPMEIFTNPEEYGTVDFSIKVNEAHLAEARNLYAPPDHGVFHLVAPAFKQRADSFYGDVGVPEITRDNVWDVYLELLHHFILISAEPDIQTVVAERANMPGVGEDADGEENMPLLPYRPFRNGDRVVGSDAVDSAPYDSDSSVEPAYANDGFDWTDGESSAGSSVGD